MRPIALVSFVVLGFGAGCDADSEPTGPIPTSRVDRQVVAFASTDRPCWAAPLADENPDVAGLQPSCSGSFVLIAGGEEELLPVCDGANEPCWRLVEDPQACPVGVMSFELEMSDVAFTPDAVATIECLLAD